MQYVLPVSPLTFQSDDLAGRVHDRRVRGDRSPDRVGRVGHVDDDHLRGLSHLLADTNVPGIFIGGYKFHFERGSYLTCPTPW